MVEEFRNFEQQAARIHKLEDSADLKSAMLEVSGKIISELVQVYKLSPLDHNALFENLGRVFTNSTLNDKHHLRELAAETIRDTMLKRGLEAPGFRDDYLEALDARMEVHVK